MAQAGTSALMAAYWPGSQLMSRGPRTIDTDQLVIEHRAILDGIVNSRRQPSHIRIICADDYAAMILGRPMKTNIIAAIKGQTCPVL
jgi:hypothetical protein